MRRLPFFGHYIKPNIKPKYPFGVPDRAGFFPTHAQRPASTLIPQHIAAATTIAKRNMRIAVHNVIQHLGFMKSELSDHHLFFQKISIVKTADGQTTLIPSTAGIKCDFYIANLNMMMQGKYNSVKKRYNNAYEWEEDDNAYLERIEKIMEALGTMLKDYRKRNRLVPLLCMEEAPIEERHIAFIQDCIKKYFPEDFDLWMYNTLWGNIVIADKNHFPFGLEFNPSAYAEKINDLNARMTTLQFTQDGEPIQTRLTNLHLPHDAPEYALNVIADRIAQSITNQIARGECLGSEIYIGDWNLPPETIQDAICNKLNEYFPHELDLQIDLSIAQSPEGHIKANKKSVTVDSSICVSFALDKENLEKAQTWVTSPGP